MTADDLSVAKDPAFGKPAFLRAKSLHIGVKLWPFLIVTDLHVNQPEIALVQSPAGGDTIGWQEREGRCANWRAGCADIFESVSG